jgi:multidrug efflux pump subunit AcrB
MCLLPALTAVRLSHGDNNIFMQIGLLVLVGLACKNAILIVEFAKHLQEEHGRDATAAVLEAAHLRLRPILMTSMAFIMGVVPLMLASGAGAEVRHTLGVTVFAGMLGVTLFGLLLTPVFYVLVRRLTAPQATPGAALLPATGAAHD